MARWTRWVPLIPLLAGCPAKTADGPCYDLCRALIEECQYEAYPTFESCLQGCAYDYEQGAQIKQEADCITEASCNTFEIVECQNAYGP